MYRIYSIIIVVSTQHLLCPRQHPPLILTLIIRCSNQEQLGESFGSLFTQHQLRQYLAYQNSNWFQVETLGRGFEHLIQSVLNDHGVSGVVSDAGDLDNEFKVWG